MVKDVSKTIEFYKSKLGFEVIGLVGDPVVYGMVKRDEFQIHFAHSPSGKVNTNRSLSSVCCDYILWIPDIDNFYEELKRQDVKIVEGITKRAYGSREFVFEDIDGHCILVGD